MDPTCLIDEVASINCLESLFGQLVSIAASLASIVLFIMLVIGGFSYLFSGGDAKKTEAAKGTLTAAILGLVLIVGAFIILVLIKAFTGIDVTIFKIPKFPA